MAKPSTSKPKPATPKPSKPAAFDSLKDAPASSWRLQESRDGSHELIIHDEDYEPDEDDEDDDYMGPKIHIPKGCTVQVKALPKAQQTEWAAVRVRIFGPDFSYTQADEHWRDTEFDGALVDIPDGHRPKVLLGDTTSDGRVSRGLFFDRC